MRTRPRHRGDAASPGSEVAVEKAQGRERARRVLRGLDPRSRASASAQICRRLLDLPEVRLAPRIVSCLSFADEVNTWPLVDLLTSSGRPVCVPRAVPGASTMTVHPFPCRLETLAMGLRQPAAEAPRIHAEDLTSADVVLVLGLAFDRHGTRLGHGRGYFDRFLATVAARPIGLCFEAQVEERLPREAHDVPMSRLVTEKRVLSPDPPGSDRVIE